MKNHEDPENRKYKCDICGKGFLSNQKLREHILTHANIKAYKCEFCSQAFSNFSGHRQHMMRKVQYIRLCKIWPYGLWRFQMGDRKLERHLPKNHHTQRKLLNFENWVNGEGSKIEHRFRK